MQVLTKDELQRFLAQAKEDGYYELFLLELGTGMRRGELMGLQWDDLNFQTGELQIVRQACAVNGKIEISVPKTKSSIRTVVLPPSLVEVLRKYKETINSRWMFPSPQNRQERHENARGRANTRGDGETARKRPVCAHRAASRAGAEKDTQKRHGMPV